MAIMASDDGFVNLNHSDHEMDTSTRPQFDLGRLIGGRRYAAVERLANEKYEVLMKDPQFHAHLREWVFVSIETGLLEGFSQDMGADSPMTLDDFDSLFHRNSSFGMILGDPTFNIRFVLDHKSTDGFAEIVTESFMISAAENRP
jgi:hypothetical protein